MPDDEPEVCIPQYEGLRLRHTGEPLEPMVVETAFPVLMHVCRESRAFVLHHSQVCFHFSEEAGCYVPARPFRPELDTVFLDQNAQGVLWNSLSAGVSDGWLSQLRHIAMPSTTTLGRGDAAAINRHFRGLWSISLVFPYSWKGVWVNTAFWELQQRRYKLRRIEYDGRSAAPPPGGTSFPCRLNSPEPDKPRVKAPLIEKRDIMNMQWIDQDTMKDFMECFRATLNRHGGETIRSHEDYDAGRLRDTEMSSSASLGCFP
ncbi:Sodium/hydrogen exchanger 2 [Madurella mycetomatis]|uniref:Sodium/hydrogen exchanger 2 n=1 Tax=Madurella mycetomatis TaxID=100816 RepID=A0A175WGC3_9PEZI|nr:Sodium/hydrogen exchanger 2 [Madurella mycetomatis]